MDKGGHPRGYTPSGDHEFRPGSSQRSRRWRFIDSPEPASSGSRPSLPPLQTEGKNRERDRSTNLFDQIMAIRNAESSSVSRPTEPKKVPVKRLQRGPQTFIGTSQAPRHAGPNFQPYASRQAVISQAPHHSGPNFQPHSSRQAGISQMADLSQTAVMRYGSGWPGATVPTAASHGERRVHAYSTNYPTPSQHQSVQPHQVRLPKECNPYYRRMSDTSPGTSSEMPATERETVTNRDIDWKVARPRYTHYGTSSHFKDARELIDRRELPSFIEGTSAYSPSNRPAVPYLPPDRSHFSEVAIALPKGRAVSFSPDTRVTDLAAPTPGIRASGSSDRITSLSMAGKRVVALDCEMIGCLEVNTPRALSDVRQKLSGKAKKRNPMFREISVAARCSIVDYSGTVLYDGYIMPNLKILSLRTKYSGITWKHLRTAAPFDSAQAEIIRLLEGCVVVGHALHNDTAALNITLPQERVRDTSTYKPLREMAGLDLGALPSLKKLANALLGIKIQKGSHCSLEDARTTLELYKLVEQAWECIS